MACKKSYCKDFKTNTVHIEDCISDQKYLHVKMAEDPGVSMYQPPDYKTEITIGEENCMVVYYLTKHFNWFQKKMMKFCFGWDVKDVGR